MRIILDELLIEHSTINLNTAEHSTVLARGSPVVAHAELRAHKSKKGKHERVCREDRLRFHFESRVNCHPICSNVRSKRIRTEIKRK